VWLLEISGEKYEAQGDFNSAIVQYRKVIQLEPSRADIHFRLGHALLANGQASDDYAEALGEFQREYELTRSSSAAYEIGEIYRKKGETEKARQYFEVALKGHRDFEEAQVGLARVLLQMDQPQMALSHLEQALKTNPDNEVSHYQMSRAYAALGNAPAQNHELQQFRRLREIKQSQQALLSQGIFQSRDVTRQTLDPDAQ
jgi:tetratricopeptide (TPR) repeat protein